jgi:hypothetical protein
MTEFRDELQQLINRHSREGASGTPDFVLAKYLDACLGAYGEAVTARDEWYGYRPTVGNVSTVTPPETLPSKTPCAVTVNGQPHTVYPNNDWYVSYEQICARAGIAPYLKPTMTCRGGRPPRTGGVIGPGGFVKIRTAGTVFDVAITSGA